MRIYVTDALKAIADNLAGITGGSYIKRRWADIIDPSPEEKRTGEEIVADVIKKAGLRLVSHTKK